LPIPITIEQDLSAYFERRGSSGLAVNDVSRPVFLAAAVLDFSLLKALTKLFVKWKNLYAIQSLRSHPMTEGYHHHEYSLEIRRLRSAPDHFNQLPPNMVCHQSRNSTKAQCTRTGKVMLDYSDARS
jgi:hypothetical protein